MILHNIGEKDVRTPPLSIGENRRSLPLAVVELLNLHPPLFNSSADIRLDKYTHQYHKTIYKQNTLKMIQRESFERVLV
jgi:hypothetical protein